MGYSYRFGTDIKTFWPDDDEKTMYIKSEGWGCTMADLMQHITDKWGEDVQMTDIEVHSEKIHTDCLTYDLYDAGDYTDFIVLKKI
jgi:hypothetical protein